MRNSLFIVLSICLILVVSCASMPVREANSDTLLIIPIENKYEKIGRIFGHYILEITQVGSKTVIGEYKIPSTGNHIFVENLEPGDYFISGLNFEYRDGPWEEVDDFNPRFCTFTIRRGEVSFTPVVFGQTNYQEESTKYITTWLAPLITEDFEGVYQRKLFQELRQEFPEAAESWQLTSFVGE